MCFIWAIFSITRAISLVIAKCEIAVEKGKLGIYEENEYVSMSDVDVDIRE